MFHKKKLFEKDKFLNNCIYFCFSFCRWKNKQLIVFLVLLFKKKNT